MKIVLMRSPTVLAPLLRRIFHIRKKKEGAQAKKGCRFGYHEKS